MRYTRNDALKVLGDQDDVAETIFVSYFDVEMYYVMKN